MCVENTNTRTAALSCVRTSLDASDVASDDSLIEAFRGTIFTLNIHVETEKQEVLQSALTVSVC